MNPKPFRPPRHQLVPTLFVLIALSIPSLAQYTPVNCGFLENKLCDACKQNPNPDSCACRSLVEGNYCATQDLNGAFHIGAVRHQNPRNGPWSFIPSDIGRRIKSREAVRDCAEIFKCMTDAATVTCTPGTTNCHFIDDGLCFINYELYEDLPCQPA